MNGLVPVTPAAMPHPAAGGKAAEYAGRMRELAARPEMRRLLPWFAGTAGLGVMALAWSMLSAPPQRMLYASLDDADRAGVVGTLDQAGIAYEIDNATGALSVGEDDLYRARMLVAAEGSLKLPESGADVLAALPMGASRTLEGDRLRAAQERDLMLTIKEIDGVEAVRVHLARAERSVFVRDEVAPSASIMVRMKGGRQLGDEQVSAIANLVAGSVPGLTLDAVRIVDQHARLLTHAATPDGERLALQDQLESKLGTQLQQLLSPMFGAEAFSAQVQVELDMAEVTSARESYDKDGSLRRETTSQSGTGSTAAGGIPGVLANTPPPETEPRPGAPVDSAAEGGATALAESSASRVFEMGREVSVSNAQPGSIKRLSVAVAVDQAALAKASAADIRKVEQLVSAAVGARTDRGDTVTVVARPFVAKEADELPFYDTGWFALLARTLAALVGVLAILLIAVRPLVKALRERAITADADAAAVVTAPATLPADGFDRASLDAQVEMAQRIARDHPEDAVLALRRLLSDSSVQERPA